MRDPRVGFVTVTGVLVTNDLSHARVMVSVPGDEAEKARALEGLQSAAGFPPQSRRRAALTTRIVPELHFELDRGLEHAARIDELLAGDPAGGAGLIGALLVDKPAGLTSHDVVQRVRRALADQAVGHTGTLDPFATGLLVVLVGPGHAARAVRRVGGQDLPGHRPARRSDRHRRPHRRGASSERPVEQVSPERVQEALAGFAGEQRQRPPGYSAKHVGGERSYRLARRGKPVEPPETTVTVHADRAGRRGSRRR